METNKSWVEQSAEELKRFEFGESEGLCNYGGEGRWEIEIPRLKKIAAEMLGDAESGKREG